MAEQMNKGKSDIDKQIKPEYPKQERDVIQW